MTLQPLRRAFLLSLLPPFCVAATACSAELSREDVSQTSDALKIIIPPVSPPIGVKPSPPAPPKDQSFLPPASWSKDFAVSTGWNPSIHVRALGDIDHDGRQDIVGFGAAGVYVARSLGTSFEPARFVVADFGIANGWTVDKHVRTLADINGDGRADIVGFGDDGVWTALSTGAGFASPVYALADLGYDQGWRVDKHVRVMADVNGDGRQDIVAFGDAGVYLSLATPSGFGPASFVIADLGANQGWDPALHVRTTGDINGDGRADIVAFGIDGVWTALSTGTGFAAPQFVLAAYGQSSAAGGWTAGGRHVRMVVDIDNDNKADILGFGESGTYASHSTGAGGFTPAQLAVADFGFTQMGYAVAGDSPRMVGDFNGDGLVNIVGYLSDETLRRSVGEPGGAFAGAVDVMSTFSRIGGWVTSGDVDGDGLLDVVGYGATDVMVERSTALPVPPPPIAPSNLRVTAYAATSLTVAWNDNSTDEQGFVVSYVDQVNNQPNAVGAPVNATSATLTGLASNTSYCFTVVAAGYFGSGTSPRVCATTLLQGPTLALTSSTHTSLGFSITGAGASALRWTLDGVTALTTQNGASASPVFTGLTAGTQYCLHAAEEVGGVWSVDSLLCAETPAVQTSSSTMFMAEDPPPYTGYISYSAKWVPQGRTITSFSSAYSAGYGIAFVRPGFNPVSDCGTPQAVVLLTGSQTLSAADVAAIAWPQTDGSKIFVGCYVGASSAVPTQLLTNVHWTE